MPPKRRVRKDQNSRLISEVHKERIIWDDNDPNNTNGYLLGKAWTRVAKALECTVTAVRSRWEELCQESKDILKSKDHPTSGSAGGKALDYSWEEFESLGFLRDKETPAMETTGNLDDLLKGSPPAEFSKKVHTPQARVPKPHEAASSKMTDEQFFKSILSDISPLNDEEKLYLRTDIYQLLCQYDTAESGDDEDVIFEGEWVPAQPQTAYKHRMVKEEDED